MRRHDIRQRIASLAPWYHQEQAHPFLWTRPWTRETLGQWVNGERGPRKFRRFIEPVLPVPIRGATVLDLGTNCGSFLFWALGRGAVRGVGIEADLRYWQQAQLLAELHEIRQRCRPPLQILLGDAMTLVARNMPSWRQTPFTYSILNAFIYHIPAGQRVPLLQAVAECSQYVVVQGNGLDPNQPDGRGFWSLAHLVMDAGLDIVRWRCEPHVRGAVVVARKR